MDKDTAISAGTGLIEPVTRVYGALVPLYVPTVQRRDRAI